MGDNNRIKLGATLAVFAGLVTAAVALHALSGDAAPIERGAPAPAASFEREEGSSTTSAPTAADAPEIAVPSQPSATPPIEPQPVPTPPTTVEVVSTPHIYPPPTVTDNPPQLTNPERVPAGGHPIQPPEALEEDSTPGTYEESADNGMFFTFPEAAAGSSLSEPGAFERVRITVMGSCKTLDDCTASVLLENTSGRVIQFPDGLTVDAIIGGPMAERQVATGHDSARTELEPGESYALAIPFSIPSEGQYSVGAHTVITLT